jgi:hypothetical protein
MGGGGHPRRIKRLAAGSAPELDDWSGPVLLPGALPCPPANCRSTSSPLYALSSPLAAGDLSHVALEVLPMTLRDAMSGYELAEAVVTGWYMASAGCEVCGGTISW